ncbi:hypothetical protein BH11BAC4_BH11BAC4_01310 [soil metagenome]
MKRIKKYVFVTGLVTLISLIQPLKGTSQVVDPGCDPLDPTCPIDGGLSLLIAAGIGLGAKKAYDRKRKSVEL